MLRIVSDGINYACGLTLAGLILSYFFNPYLGIPLYVIALFCLWFFRDPERKPPSGDVMVAPADGKVISIRKGSDELVRVSIFLNIFNVHVARSPAAGAFAGSPIPKGSSALPVWKRRRLKMKRAPSNSMQAAASSSSAWWPGLLLAELSRIKAVETRWPSASASD